MSARREAWAAYELAAPPLANLETMPGIHDPAQRTLDDLTRLERLGELGRTTLIVGCLTIWHDADERTAFNSDFQLAVSTD